MLSANARVFQTLVIAIIAMFMISQSEIITFAEEFFIKTLFPEKIENDQKTIVMDIKFFFYFFLLL